MNDIRLERHLAGNFLQLILMPTEACNFRCVYCYEDFELGRMQPGVIGGVKNLLSRRAPGLALLQLTWFGGEPLLASSVIEDILGHAKQLSRDNDGLRLFSDMTTNGYLLTPKMMERLLALGLTEFQITLDGPAEWHDRTRVGLGGGPTFDRIWENLVALRSLGGDFRILVRLQAHRFNASSLRGFMRDYAGVFAGDDRYRLFIREVSRLGGPNDATLPVLEGEERHHVLGSLTELARTLGIDFTTREVAMSTEAAVCYAAAANSFVVRADGRLGKCTVALDQPENQVGHLLEDGRLKLDAPRMRTWMRGLWSADAGELVCPLDGIESQPLVSIGGTSGSPAPPAAG